MTEGLTGEGEKASLVLRDSLWVSLPSSQMATTKEVDHGDTCR
jgi:hypothetical protein